MKPHATIRACEGSPSQTSRYWHGPVGPQHGPDRLGLARDRTRRALATPDRSSRTSAAVVFGCSGVQREGLRSGETGVPAVSASVEASAGGADACVGGGPPRGWITHGARRALLAAPGAGEPAQARARGGRPRACRARWRQSAQSIPRRGSRREQAAARHSVRPSHSKPTSNTARVPNESTGDTA